MIISRFALVSLMLAAMPLLGAEDPPEAPSEPRLSVEDTREFVKSVFLLQQTQKKALRKENESLMASLNAKALNDQVAVLSAKIQEFVAQRRPRAGCEPTIEGKWNCPPAPEDKKGEDKK